MKFEPQSVYLKFFFNKTLLGLPINGKLTAAVGCFAFFFPTDKRGS